MLRIHSILYPTDFSPCAGAAWPHALHLARQHEAAIHMLYVTPVFEDDPARKTIQAVSDEPAFYKHLRDEATERMHALIQTYGGSDVQVKLVYEQGVAPGPVLLAYAEAEDIDLIVMGTHGWRGVRRMLLGSVAAEIVRKATCPVLTARAREEPETAPFNVRRILVPIDFSAFSEEALMYAKELAGSCGAALDLLHCIDPPFQFELQALSLMQRGRVLDALKEEAVTNLEELIHTVGGPVLEASHHILVGPAPTVILDFAVENAVDLILLASHGRTGLERLLMGSVAEHVVRGASCPVLVTKPFGKSLLPAAAAKAAETGRPFPAGRSRPGIA